MHPAPMPCAIIEAAGHQTNLDVHFLQGQQELLQPVALCDAYCENFSEVLAVIKKLNAST